MFLAVRISLEFSRVARVFLGETRKTQSLAGQNSGGFWNARVWDWGGGLATHGCAAVALPMGGRV